MDRLTSILTSRLLLTSGVIGLSAPAAADFLQDSKTSLELRNFYFNRDYRQTGAPQSKQEEWAQGFLLRYESGFTEGAVGFGVDALGQLGVKLDSSQDRAGSGLLPREGGPTGRSVDEASKLGLTAKVRASNSLLKLGTLQPKLTVLQAHDGRLLPQTFEGVHLNSKEFDGVNFDAGQLKQVTQRDSTNSEDMTISTTFAKGIRVRKGASSDAFNFGGISYKWNANLNTSYYYANLDGFYNQHVLSLLHVLPLGVGQSLKSDIRFARSNGEGGSNIDNKALNAMFTYSLGSHAFGLGYQKMSGDTGYAYIGASDAYLVNFVQVSDFASKDERSWQARYDYNFASVGVPGLTFMTRYLRGDDIDLGPGKQNGAEWERDTDIAYVFQSGPLKNLGVRWRNATVRASHFGSDMDENRLIFSYPLQL